MRAVRFTGLVLCCLIPLAIRAAEEEERSGSRALPGAHRTLADLLEEADRDPPRPPPPPRAAPQAPAEDAAQPAPNDAAAADPKDEEKEKDEEEDVPPDDGTRNPARLKALIARRHRIVDACDFFDTLKEVVRQEQVLAVLVNEWNHASTALARAEQHASLQPNAGLPPPQAAQPAAPADQSTAQATLQSSQLAFQQADNAVTKQKLKPLYSRLGPHVGPWAQVYRDMAAFIVPRRSDPDRQALIAMLESAISKREDFFEGRILAAFGHAYDGDAETSDAHLAKAITFIQAYAPGLYPTRMTHDCAAVCILAAKTGRIKEFVKMIEGIHPLAQSIHQQWIVANFAVREKREATARTYFHRALVKAGAFKKPEADETDEALAPIDAVLAGDAAHFYLTQSTVSNHDVEMCRRIIERADPAAVAWQLTRARAALAARQGEWLDALHLVTGCLEDCPATIKREVEAELRAYRENRRWTRH